MKLIKPIIDKNTYHIALQEEIYAFLYDNIFRTLFDILNAKPVIKQASNAPATPLIQALTQGLITYEENKYFKGKLNAAISKQLRAMGAKYNSTVKAYQIEPAKIPPDIQAAIAASSARAREKVQKVQDYLKSIEGRELPEMKIELSFGKTLTDLEKQFENTTRKVVPSNLEVSMAPGHQEALKTAYAENLEKYIKQWYDEEILRLRSKVMDNTIAGFRSENLIHDIQAENGVTYRKAKFLARQETSLLVSKYREVRYTDNGINYYTWSTSHDERVRRRHRELNGKVFRFDQPPVVDIHKMRRANPGEDFNCRCVAIPVISDSMEMSLKLKGQTQHGIQQS